MKKTLILAFVLSVCGATYEIVSPETTVHYKQSGKDCRYSEQHGKWFYETRESEPFFVVSNKRTVIYDNTDCVKILDEDMKNQEKLDVFYKSSLAAPSLEQEVGMNYNIK